MHATTCSALILGICSVFLLKTLQEQVSLTVNLAAEINHPMQYEVATITILVSALASYYHPDPFGILPTRL
jgi:hypothetical protein